ncbi:DoxX family membrane protein [Sanguibacter antarcticus]|uniref:DoxX-like protein n=1 Tax=Sanguibacter antarcticus TaxID=372484 RepID=A0A2A9E156_9MICO|nr:DoxX family membrane protein [Sanguibacter antarcticus]PFG32584.1 DoxX-like protein [Sanguibacter antarcticus]
MLLRPIARPLLATWFIHDGLDAALHPGRHLESARGPADQVSALVGGAPHLTDSQVKTAVRVHGGLTVVAGAALAVGRAPRSAALFLALLTVPLAIADQPFTSGTVARSVRTEQFVRRLGAVGAALLAGVDYEGRPGITWRVEHSKAARAASRAAVRATD